MKGLARDGVYSFDDLDGGFNGLIRVSENGSCFERVDNGEWVADQELARHFVDPGSTFLEPIDDELAEQLAARYAVAL